MARKIKAEASAFDPSETYVQLRPDGAGMPIAVGPDFWEKTIASVSAGWLVTAFGSDADWTYWEMHPNGEELIFLVSGYDGP